MTPGEARRGGAAEHEMNVSEPERWASFIGGAILALIGLQRRSLGGALIALLGGSLFHRAVTGHCYTYGALGVNSRTREPPLPSDADPVSEASEESFPASDAPAWTPTVAAGAPRGP